MPDIHLKEPEQSSGSQFVRIFILQYDLKPYQMLESFFQYLLSCAVDKNVPSN